MVVSAQLRGALTVMAVLSCGVPAVMAQGIAAPPAGGAAGIPATAADLLSRRLNLADPDERAQVVAQLRVLEEARRREVLDQARRLGIPLSGDRPDGGEFVLHSFEGNDPVYEQTENVNAAISTAADLVRDMAPFSVDGAGQLIGLWETSLPLAGHEEFGSPSRLSLGEGSVGSGEHATHVAGTLIAAGVSASRKGMAPAAQITAYTSGGDAGEMTAIGASAPGEAGKIHISNHSYGFKRGWSDGNVWKGGFSNDGDPSNDYEDDFGRYSSYSVSMDGLTYNLPYYLPFFSAGNHRNDGPPANDETWYVGSTSGSSYAYNNSQHPAGDGDYKNGYDTCEGKKVAKNVMTVGAVNDAVSGGSRSVGAANLINFSSTGPTDDGRIKPDIVANGNSLVSAGSASSTDTATKSGTSMASPNAAGSAALLVDYYDSCFPGGAMRASTLKGLIIHTADDLGNPGPDYRYGWGLMNTEAAASVIRDHADQGGGRIFEDQVTTAAGSQSWQVLSDGSGPLWVTLSWTDPPGSLKTGHDNRVGVLVNDLNLSITGPGGTHLPWVMPHVGDWSLATLDDNATTGVNVVDPVEQVYVAAPAAGTYTVTVDHAGALTYDAQEFSLIVSGIAPDPLLVTPEATFLSGGPTGGLFSPATSDYTLTNNGTEPVSWSAADDAVWLELSPLSGSLAPGGTAIVSASLTTDADGLAPGAHTAVMTFTNTGTGLSTQVDAQLTVVAVASLPFVEDFEGTMESYWEIGGTGSYRAIQSTANGPQEGLQHFLMDSTTDRTFARNELTLTIDLSGRQDVLLSFWAREFLDEPHAPPSSPFTGGADFDGVAISPDGVNWYSVLAFPSAFSTYVQFHIDLDAQVAFHGISYTDQFRIRFNQYDNYEITTDGIALDDIRVSTSPPLTFASLPLTEDFEGGLASHWKISGTGTYRTEPSTENFPHGGARHVQMDSVADGSVARNELTLGIDLSGAQGVELAFWAKEFGDELHTPPGSPFVDGADFDGVAVSPDGTNWYSVFSFPSDFETYTRFTIDLDAAVAGHGISYNDQFRIRFNQFDNTSLPLDGIAFDDVEISAWSPLESWRFTHFGTTEDAGDAANLADPNGDGIINLLAFATGLHPLQSGGFPLTVELAGGDLVVHYPRSLAAVAEGLTVEIEWADTLPGPWSTVGVGEVVTGDDGLLQAIEVTLPQGSAGRRFVRLRVTE